MTKQGGIEWYYKAAYTSNYKITRKGYYIMATRKSVYFSEGLDEILLEHTKQFKNFSNYVKLLIRLDIERNLTGLNEKSYESNTKEIKVKSKGLSINFEEKRRDKKG